MDPKRLVVGLMLVLALVGAGGAAHFYWNRHRDDLPSLKLADVNEDGRAARVTMSQGAVWARPSLPADAEGLALSPLPSAADGDWTKLEKDSPLKLGALIRLGPAASAQLWTGGNFTVVLDGEGEFLFEDARRDDDGKSHTAVFHVKRGTFRAKPHEYDTGDHRFEVRTAGARVLVRQGEIGLRIDANGVAQIWLVRGEAVVRWNDGRRKELKPGLDYL